MAKRKPKNTWIMILSGVITLALIASVLALDTLGTPITVLIRGGALLGYLAVFLTSLSSLYMRELTRFFGRSFIKLHHTVAVTALVALTLHGGSVAWNSGSLSAFLPRFDSLQVFLSLGGRPALWLFALTSLTALLRTSIGKNWKIIHWLNYVAFWLGTIHAQMIGTSFARLGIRLLSAAMALALIAVFVQKRVKRARARKR